MATILSLPELPEEVPAVLPYIILELVPVTGTGLEYYNISLAMVNVETSQAAQSQRLDSHWQEDTAWQCAERWSKRYNLPIYNAPLLGAY